VRDGVLHEALHRPPGKAVEYTDRAALILGYLAEHLSGQPLDRLALERGWQPLSMAPTRFGPLPAASANVSRTAVPEARAKLIGGGELVPLPGRKGPRGETYYHLPATARFLAEQATEGIRI
jgi:CubicO group peptidase (beta-lactamase class C family)